MEGWHYKRRLPGHDASWTGHTTALRSIQKAAVCQQLHRPLSSEISVVIHLIPAAHQADTDIRGLPDASPRHHISETYTERTSRSLNGRFLALKNLLQTRAIQRRIGRPRIVNQRLTLINIVLYVCDTAVVSMNNPTASHICMHVCVCIYAYMYACVRMYVCMYVSKNECMHACIHVCMYVGMYVCMYVCIHA